ncbi:MAG: hypothetical protein B7Y75_05410 [Azorhizobium sp. 35-67-5]|nr:MAG: hypothetical protein B7Y75_05410 [Azorhizobium sp. 35-67-5]
MPAALRYSQQIYPRKKTDALWLLNYGDLLAQAGDSRRAGKVRAARSCLKRIGAPGEDLWLSPRSHQDKDAP